MPKSLRPKSKKLHDATYGWGEAVSAFPGWEPLAAINYVYDRFQWLNTDQARAAFCDKWLVVKDRNKQHDRGTSLNVRTHNSGVKGLAVYLCLGVLGLTTHGILIGLDVCIKILAVLKATEVYRHARWTESGSSYGSWDEYVQKRLPLKQMAEKIDQLTLIASTDKTL